MIFHKKILITLLLIIVSPSIIAQLTFKNKTTSPIRVYLNWTSKNFATDCSDDEFSLNEGGSFNIIKNYTVFSSQTCTLKTIIIKNSNNEEIKTFSHENTPKILPFDVKSEDYPTISLEYKNKNHTDLILKID